ncbi:MAG: gspD2 [Actinobacteria bacterium]|nr:gspD2 [Actinomycetota bacterium]
MKFNNADVYEVIHTLGRIAGINYLIDPRVRGVVNVHTQGTVKKDDALELLYSILRVNGATAVREGDLYHIVPMNEAKTEPLLVEEARDAVFPNRPVMRAFPLQFIAAAEMAKVIKPFVSPGGDAVEVPRANVLLVVDTAGNMDKHARLVELFDADAFRSAGVRMFPLKFLDPEEMAKSLESIFGALDFGTKGGKPAGINFVPLARLNSLLVVSASPKAMENVERWIGELDREPSKTSRAVHLYRVKHGKVKDVAAVLERLYPSRTSPLPAKPTEFKPQVGEPAGAKPYILSNPTTPAAPAPSTPGRPQAGAEKKDGEGFDIIPDEPTNSLIIRGSLSEYAAILDTLKAIDVYPRQVLLEVLVGEVQLDDSMKLGIDWNYVWMGDGVTKHTTSMVTSLAGATTGLKYVVDRTNRLTAAFRGLATDGKVSILSSPSVIAANGRKAKIQVADSVPITTASIVANSNPPVTTQTVEYRDVGVILSFTPYINDQGIVTLEIEQEVSEISTTEATSTTNPSFFKRNVQTTLIATEDQSIVLGGLVKERKSRSREGVPFLSQIPFLGWIFGARSDVLTRNELVIFITPRVIASAEDGTRLSREFEDRVHEIKERIGQAKGIKHPVPASAPAEPKK